MAPSAKPPKWGYKTFAGESQKPSCCQVRDWCRPKSREFHASYHTASSKKRNWKIPGGGGASDNRSFYGEEGKRRSTLSPPPPSPVTMAAKWKSIFADEIGRPGGGEMRSGGSPIVSGRKTISVFVWKPQRTFWVLRGLGSSSLKSPMTGFLIYTAEPAKEILPCPDEIFFAIFAIFCC